MHLHLWLFGTKLVTWENTKAVGATFRQLVASNSCSAKINDETPIMTT